MSGLKMISLHPKTSSQAHHQRQETDHIKRRIPTISILLPPCQLINDGQTHTFLESSIRVCSPAQCVPVEQQPQRKVKVLRDVSFGPLFCLSISWVDERRILHGGPAQERIVPDKGSYFAVGTAEGDTFVDTLREMGDPVFKVVVGDLHDICEQEWSAYDRGLIEGGKNENSPDSCWIIATSGLSNISLAASLKQSSGTTVSESMIRIISPIRRLFPFAHQGRNLRSDSS